MRRILEKAAGKKCVRKFYQRSGRASTWWDNFINDIIVPKEWIENLQMCKEGLTNLYIKLKPFVERNLVYLHLCKR